MNVACEHSATDIAVDNVCTRCCTLGCSCSVESSGWLESWTCESESESESTSETESSGTATSNLPGSYIWDWELDLDDDCTMMDSLSFSIPDSQSMSSLNSCSDSFFDSPDHSALCDREQASITADAARLRSGKLDDLSSDDDCSNNDEHPGSATARRARISMLIREAALRKLEWNEYKELLVDDEFDGFVARPARLVLPLQQHIFRERLGMRHHAKQTCNSAEAQGHSRGAKASTQTKYMCDLWRNSGMLGCCLLVLLPMNLDALQLSGKRYQTRAETVSLIVVSACLAALLGGCRRDQGIDLGSFVGTPLQVWICFVRPFMPRCSFPPTLRRDQLQAKQQTRCCSLQSSAVPPASGTHCARQQRKGGIRRRSFSVARQVCGRIAQGHAFEWSKARFVCTASVSQCRLSRSVQRTNR
eukprot:SAG31_NODE_3173_length_4588_cov_3.009388_4_plen_418_part_00